MGSQIVCSVPIFVPKNNFRLKYSNFCPQYFLSFPFSLLRAISAIPPLFALTVIVCLSLFAILFWLYLSPPDWKQYLHLFLSIFCAISRFSVSRRFFSLTNILLRALYSTSAEFLSESYYFFSCLILLYYFSFLSTFSLLFTQYFVIFFIFSEILMLRHPDICMFHRFLASL